MVKLDKGFNQERSVYDHEEVLKIMNIVQQEEKIFRTADPRTIRFQCVDVTASVVVLGKRLCTVSMCERPPTS